ncbi:MAG: D-alanyl-D-alanine carboxypeptidase [Acidobacteriota bacterium]
MHGPLSAVFSPVLPGLAAVLVGALCAASGPEGAVKAERPPDLVWHVEDAAGEVLSSRAGDEPINPASVVKVATSLWALEKLGPSFRFKTRLFMRGDDLVVAGGQDPDFQPENAFLLAAALEALSVRVVPGRLLVDRSFWMGWEYGQRFKIADGSARVRRMAARLRQALDPERWDADLDRAWNGFAQRRRLDPDRPVRIAVAGTPGILRQTPAEPPFLLHESEPVLVALRRFNCYSNNDIQRFQHPLGPARTLQEQLARRWDVPAGALRLESLSGLGRNRLTPRLVVRLLRDLQRTLLREDLRVEDVLPVAGCDPGSLNRFTRLTLGVHARSVVAKSGTLASTDGGILVLAGLARTARGDLLFCVAAPRSGRRLDAARQAEESWLTDLIGRFGGSVEGRCAGPLPYSDGEARVSAPTPARSAAGW